MNAFVEKFIYFFLGFLILHISHQPNVLFSSINLSINQLFKVGVPSFASDKASNKVTCKCSTMIIDILKLI